MSMHLNLFTNCTVNAPSTKTIEDTFISFSETFGIIPYTVYVDPNPNREAYDDYLENLYNIFGGTIIETTGLADGYIQSIESGKADYLFQLEHDWTFQNIHHSLRQFEVLMAHTGLPYLRFNKHPNVDYEWLRKWQSFLMPNEALGIPYCLTDNISNNPHIIDREYYKREVLHRIKRESGAEGIEQNLEKRDIIGAVYGGLNHPATILHLDGRHAYSA